MDSATAALIGAALGFVGSLVGNVAAPWIRGHFERKGELERERRAALTDAISELLEVFTVKYLAASAEPANGLVDEVKAMLKVQMLLRKDEERIGTILRVSSTAMGLDGAPAAEIIGSLMAVMSSWLRKDITVAEAEQMFVTNTGIKLVAASR